MLPEIESLMSVVTLKELSEAIGKSLSYTRNAVVMYKVVYRKTSGNAWLVSVDSAMKQFPEHLRERLGIWYDAFLKNHDERK